MCHTTVIHLPYETFAHDPSFQQLARPLTCCGQVCDCLGYAEHQLIYRCSICQTHYEDSLPCEPLFALEPLEAALFAHYEITCPYCQEQAVLVGGNNKAGLFFVCQKHCHVSFSRTIRRF